MKKLFIILVLAFCTVFAGCITSYHIHTFSNDVETLPLEETVSPHNQNITKLEPAGLFKGGTYEEAMRKAKEAGYTRVLSVEYGTRHVLGLFSFRWVEIRCVKGGGGEEVAPASGRPTDP